MKQFIIILFTLSILLTITLTAIEQDRQIPVSRFTDICDASAAVAIDSTLFVVANDEDNILRIYDTIKPGKPVASFDMNRFLNLDYDKKSPETDIEGATWFNDTIVWITSHGRNKDGIYRPNRYRIFGTRIERNNDAVEIIPFGIPYRYLLRDLLRDEKMNDFGLYEASLPGIEQDETLIPKENGLNIEALTATKDGDALLIGFRNPRPGGKALLVRLSNPLETLTGQARTEFAEPMLFDFDGLGFRSIEYSPPHNSYIIVAGPHDGNGDFSFYAWSGKHEEPPNPLPLPHTLSSIKDFTPEALIVNSGKKQLQLLSDDGGVKVSDPENNGKECDCKDLENPRDKSFRSIWIDVGNAPY